MSQQLVLNIYLDNAATFDNFYVGNNAILLKALHDMVRGEGEPFVYCWGEVGVGRSHLLQACCHVSSQINKASVYIPLSRFQELTPEVLIGLEAMSLVCLDNIDAVLGNSEWELALFHFYNRLRDANRKLLISANNPPQYLLCDLPDLASRLSSGLVFQVLSLDDEQKLAALQLRAKLRGFVLSEKVGKFLLHHKARDFSSLFSLLEKLDRVSLEQQKKLTIPFLKTVLGV